MVKEKILCPICKSNLLRKAVVNKFWYLKCWNCKKMFTKNLLFELKEVGEIMKTHYIIESGEAFNYILACGLKYKDSDNINSSKDINKVTCEKCLKKEGGRNSSQS